MIKYLICSLCFSYFYFWEIWQWDRLLLTLDLVPMIHLRRWDLFILVLWCVLRWRTLVYIFYFIIWGGSSPWVGEVVQCWVRVCCVRERRLLTLNDRWLTGVVSVHVDVFRSEGKFEGVLDDIFVEFIVEEGVWIFLPGDSF